MSRKLLFVTAVLAALAAAARGQIPTPPVPVNLKAELDHLMMGPTPVVKLTWEAPDGPWGYAVYRSVGDTLHYQPVAKTDIRLFYDRAVVMGNLYYYTLRSFVQTADGQMIQSGPSRPARIDLRAPVVAARGVVAGIVKDDSSGMPLPGIPIRFFRQGAGIFPAVVPTVVTDRSGFYKALLDTGTYLICADPPPVMFPGVPQYKIEWFDNAKDRSSATAVIVTEGKTFAADFGLGIVPPPVRPRGIVVGKVTDEATLKPIQGAVIRFHRVAPMADFRIIMEPPVAITDSMGLYRAMLDTGRYFIRAEGPRSVPWPGYRPEWFDNVVEPTAATPVAIADGGTSVVDFGLIRLMPPPLSTIEGLVTDTMGVPLRKATVAVLLSLQQMTQLSLWPDNPGWPPGESMEIEGLGFSRGIVWRGYTDSTGRYRAVVPAGGRYVVMATRWGYIPEYYKEQPGPTTADILTADGPLAGIDFTLALLPGLRNSISGTVRDSLGRGVPSRIVLFPVHPWWPASPAIRFGHTDSSGGFTLGELRAGKYFVLALPFRGHAPSFYRAGAFGVMCWKNADTVAVSGNIAGIDIGVIPLQASGVGSIAGRVLTEGGVPLEGARVFASLPGGALAGFAMSDGSGLFALEGLPAGPLTLTLDRDGYLPVERSVSLSPTGRTAQAGDLRLSPALTLIGNPAAVEPQGYVLHPNYPNPFNPSTTITYDMPGPGIATLTVFSMLGQEVVTLVDGPVPAGRHQAVWEGVDRNGQAVAGGIYFVKLSVSGMTDAAAWTQVRKMVLLR